VQKKRASSNDDDCVKSIFRRAFFLKRAISLNLLFQYAGKHAFSFIAGVYLSPPPRDFAERKIHKSRNQPEVKEKEREERERKGGKHEETY
jgi:hypothetical protein